MPAPLAYKPTNKLTSQYLRYSATIPERVFWRQLLWRDKTGFRFYRQKPIGPYIVDFYCSKLKLAIELDGYSHEQTWEKDNYREIYLSKLGIKTIRYHNKQIREVIEYVYQDLCNQITNRKAELHIP